jgi:hypothetical protein
MFATVIGHLAHRTHLDLPEFSISTEAASAFVGWGKGAIIRQQLHLMHSQTLELEAADTAAGTFLRVQHMMSRKLWVSQFPPME